MAKVVAINISHECAIFKLVGDYVMPKEGIFARVIKGGIVRPGDEITIEK